jgi:hypothetical protein
MHRAQMRVRPLLLLDCRAHSRFRWQLPPSEGQSNHRRQKDEWRVQGSTRDD